MAQKQLRAEQEVAAVLRGERQRYDFVQATVPYAPSDAAVAGRPGWILVWLHGDPDSEIEVFNPSTPIASGSVVDLERIFVPGAPYYRVKGIAANFWYGDAFGYSQYYASGITGGVGNHAAQHQRRDFGTGGFDPLDVYTRMLVPLRAQAQATPDLTIYVSAGYYNINTFKYWAGGNSATFTPPGVGTPSRYDLLYIGNDDALHIVQGTAAGWGTTPSFPSVPSGAVPLAFIYLTATTTAITESNIVDARVVLTASTAASGTGDASADAAYVLASPFAALPSGVVVASGISMRGPLGARPATTAVAGAFYFVTGSGAQRLTRWTGAAWENVTDNNVLQTGVVRGNRHRLNFSGSGVSVWDDPANDWLNIDVGGNAAGGDLSGTYPNPTVAKLQGRSVASTAPNTGDALAWNGSQWMPSGIAGVGGGGGSDSGKLFVAFSNTDDTQNDGSVVLVTDMEITIPASNAARYAIVSWNVFYDKATGTAEIQPYVDGAALLPNRVAPNFRDTDVTTRQRSTGAELFFVVPGDNADHDVDLRIIAQGSNSNVTYKYRTLTVRVYDNDPRAVGGIVI